MMYSPNPVSAYLAEYPDGASDIAAALCHEGNVLIRSGECLALVFPDHDCWHVQYAAGPIGRVARMIYLAVPYELPFVSFHRRYGSGVPRIYPASALKERFKLGVEEEKYEAPSGPG